MIDYFAIALTHGLIAIAAWRMLSRDDLDAEGADPAARKDRPWLRGQQPQGQQQGPGDA